MPKNRPMSRTLRWLLAGVILLATAAIIGWFGVAPMYVRSLIAQTLRDGGVDASSFKLDSLGITRAHVSDVRLGVENWLTIGTIDLTFSPLSLWRGRLKSIHIHQADWRIRIRDGEVDLGPRFGAATKESSEDPPFDELQITNAIVRVEIDGVQSAFDVKASARRTGWGRFDVHADAHAKLAELAGVTVEQPTFGIDLVMASLDGKRTVAGTVDVRAESVAAQEYALKVQRVEAAVPFTMGGGAVDHGSIRTGAISWRDVTMPGISGTLAVPEMRLKSHIDWPLTSEATLTMDGWAELGDRPIHGRLTAVVPSFELSDTALLTSLVPELRDVHIGGQYEMNAEIGFESRNAAVQITVVGQHMSAAGEKWPGSIDDADAHITITSLHPLVTESNQVLFVNRGKFGKIDVTDATIAFSLESPSRLAVHHASWRMASDATLGDFELSPFVADPTNLRIQSTLHCEDVYLGPWLEMLTKDRVTSDGRLEGLIAFEFDPQTTSALTLGNGALMANPAQGNIRIKDRVIAEELLDQVDVGAQKYAVEVKDRIVAALEDFEYSSLNIEFSPEAKDYVCQVQASGKGRTGPNPQEFAAIVVNVHNFNTLLRDAVTGSSIYQQLKE
jgi:hypothetical protein